MKIEDKSGILRFGGIVPFVIGLLLFWIGGAIVCGLTDDLLPWLGNISECIAIINFVGGFVYVPYLIIKYPNLFKE